MKKPMGKMTDEAEKNVRETMGRESGRGESSVIKRNIHGTRPFTGDVMRRVDRESYGREDGDGE